MKVVAVQAPWVIPAVIAFSVVFYGLLGCVILQGYRWLKRKAQTTQEAALEGLKIHDDPAPGLVEVVFHTYYGFIAFTHETKHEFWATPDDAREALRRLHRFNLVWGMFAHGAVLIPLVSYGNFLA